MTFLVPAEAYVRFMGRFSEPLAAGFADACGVRPGQRVLDVGCGPGALTAELVRRLGPDAVTAIDPSPPFVEAAAARFPRVDVRTGAAEDLPFADGTFDAALAQLVVHFMADPIAGLREMGRVTRPGGTVGACVWDHGGAQGPLSVFWAAVHDLAPDAPGEADRAGTHQGQLVELARAAGLAGAEPGAVSTTVAFPTFDDWWEPFTLGVGPAGAYVAGLDGDHRAALRDRCAELLPTAPFTVTVSAWSVTARV
ncbi:MAG TPA: class I SAM-dependent methyltransferase [Propionibacteriaceae bacterium]|nr:class I SAM-dependent methyltransferase [Propionibacteriaceae bacterium]